MSDNRESIPQDQYNDTNDSDIRAKQHEGVEGSEALGSDDDIATGDVKVLPGTGGPDDVGDVEVDPEEINLPGFEGHS